jgi:hypothetical protein
MPNQTDEPLQIHCAYFLIHDWPQVSYPEIKIIGCSGPPLWSSGQSSWLWIQRSGFDSRRYQIFWAVVGLEQGPLSLVSTIEELLERKSSGSGLAIQQYGLRDLSRWPHGTLYPQKLALTSPTSGSRSVGIVRSLTQAMELVLFVCFVLVVQHTIIA